MKEVAQIFITAVASYFLGPLGTTWAMAFKSAIIMTAVTTAASYLFRPKLGSAFGIDNRGRMIRQPLTSRKVVYGYQRVSGPIVFITSTNNNKFLHLVIALADHEIQEYGSFWIGENEVAIDPSTGFVTNAEYIKNGNPLVRIRAKLGTDNQVADSDLVSEVTEWTTDHRLRGVAYMYVRLEYDSQVFQDGIPNMAASILGKKVFDYRTSTTAYSFNPALVLADYLRSTRHGLGAEATEINAASFIAAANICDENVNLAFTPSARAQSYLGTSLSGSTWRERRYQCHGVIDTEKNPGEVIEELLSSMGGTLAYIGGQWTVKAAAYSSPAITLTVDDLRGPITSQTKVPRNESFNAIKGVFINPDANWQASDYPAITSATFVTEDGNNTNFVDLNLPYTLSSSMAQRLAKIALFRNRQEITLSLPCKLKAFNLKPGDTVNVTIDRYGFTNKVFEVVDWKLAFSEQDMGVDLQLRELNAAVFDWNADERLFNEDNTTLPNSFAPPPILTNVSFSSVARINTDGTAVPVNTLTWTQSPNIFVLSGGYIEVRFKAVASLNWTSLNRIQGDGVEAIIEGLQPGASVDVQVRAVNVNNIPSDWVTLLNQLVAGDTTAPAAPSGLTATGAQRTVQLAWTNPAVADYFTTDIFRNTTNNSGTAVLIGTISGSTYADSGLAAATTFYYWVKARDFSGNVSGFSNGASATTDAAAVSAATTPRSGSGFIFYTLASASAPTAPTASNFNFSTNTFGSLSANWSTTFTAPTSTQSKFWAVQYRVQEATHGGGQTVTISAVFNWQNFDGLVTFTNLTTDAGTTFINGANITTGSVTANKVSFTVVGTSNVVGTINASTEGVRVAGNRISIDGNVTFSAGYDPTTKIAAGGAAADINNNVTTISGGKITTGSIAADKINVTDLIVENLKTSASGQRVEITKTNNDLRIFNASSVKICEIGGTSGALATFLGNVESGETIFATNDDAVAIKGSSGTELGIYGLSTSQSGVFGTSVSNIGIIGQTGTAGGNNHAVRGMNVNGAGTDLTTAGLIGAANGFDFYADGDGTNYGPFTGSHDALTDPNDSFVVGDIVIDKQVLRRNGISSTITIVETSSEANQKAAIGVVCALPHPFENNIPAVYMDGFDKKTRNPIATAEWETDKDLYNLMAVNSVGEGQINVCGEGGDIEAGDLIVTSSIPGKGMKQSDDIVRAVTVAKARESVQFSGNEIKQIACIYLCG